MLREQKESSVAGLLGVVVRVRQSETRKLGKDQITQCLSTIRFWSLSQEQEEDYCMLLSREISYSFYLALNKIKNFP